MLNNATISIVVPVYNVIGELERCVSSIVSQTYANIEVILVDDGSTDGSGDLCEVLAKQDERMRVIHKENGGLSSARNAGMKVAAGEWLMFVDSDDAILADACEGLYEIADELNPDIVIGDALRETESGGERICHDALAYRQVYRAEEYVKIAIVHEQFYAPSCFNMYKRAFMETNNLQFVDGLLHEDMEIQPRVFLAAETVAYTGKIFYRYIDRESSIMNASGNGRRADAMRLIYGLWKIRFDKIADKELKELLYAHLAKCYLHTIRTLKCRSLEIDGIDSWFLIKFGLNLKEKAKALLYAVSPNLFISIGGQKR